MSLTYLWDFGDGYTSTEETPVHIYTKVGTYTVSLTVTDDILGTVTETKTNYITVTRKDLDKFKTTKSYSLGISGEMYGSSSIQSR